MRPDSSVADHPGPCTSDRPAGTPPQRGCRGKTAALHQPECAAPVSPLRCSQHRREKVASAAATGILDVCPAWTIPMNVTLMFRAVCYASLVVVLAVLETSAPADVITTGDVDPGGAAVQSDPWPVGGKLYVGKSAAGTLNVEAGSVVSNTYGYIGYNHGSMGTATVSGGYSPTAPCSPVGLEPTDPMLGAYWGSVGIPNTGQDIDLPGIGMVLVSCWPTLDQQWFGFGSVLGAVYVGRI